MRWGVIWVPLILAAIVLVVGLILLGLIGDFLVDWAWFSALGYAGVFWTVLAAKGALFSVVLAASFVVLWINAWLAVRRAGRHGPMHRRVLEWQSVGARTIPDLMEALERRVPLSAVIVAVALVVSLLIAAGEIGNWDLLLRFVNQVPYGQSDPVYGKDVGFYLFSLPAYVAAKNWMLATLACATIFAAAIYWAHGDIELTDQRRFFSGEALAHGSALLGIFFLIKAWSYDLDRFLLLYGDNGVVVGASYTDVAVELPVLWLLIGLGGVGALTCFANVRARRSALLAAAAILVFGASIVLGALLPAIFQRVYVKPNELELERPYIERNIALTQQAYNLHQITAKSFAVEQNLNFGTVENNPATIDNIRLWDWQPLMDTLAQMQEIRTYYRFNDVDVDRYWLGGSYQAVMLAARELDPSLLPPNAQTWVNRHVLFTHGYGVVMNPVTRKNPEGLPIFYLQNIPPVATGGPAIEQPRIYFGERSDDYVIVNGTSSEFDYPNGQNNVYARYDGTGGVAIGGIVWRVLFAWYFEDLNILLTGYIGPESRILFRRAIQQRVRTIAPFLALDHDPYIVIADGRLFWMQDAYTTSDYFPYAPPARNSGLNYIRNSVKIVIDAYDGTVNFYLADASDAIAATYARIFPGLLKPLSAMSAGLKQHIRYPEDLFLIQARIYRAYHMNRPEVFYNREDLWQFPRQPGSPAATMIPYYIIMRLPGEAKAQFFLMLPMVPSQRQNMIAWLAARCDAPEYGKLIVYEFPKDKLVYGPFQIEAMINQNTEISRQLSLWNQLGSRVIRGHLIVIPIEHSILYVSPLYLRAETGQLPELKRVIAAYGDRVVMEETLDEALAALFNQPSPSSGRTAPRPPATTAESDQAREALAIYGEAIEHLKAGDWAGFGSTLDKLRSALEQMRGDTGVH
jgi:uncharacterized protein